VEFEELDIEDEIGSKEHLEDKDEEEDEEDHPSLLSQQVASGTNAQQPFQLEEMNS